MEEQDANLSQSNSELERFVSLVDAAETSVSSPPTLLPVKTTSKPSNTFILFTSEGPADTFHSSTQTSW